MGAVAAAIRRSAESFGAEVRTDAPVAALLVDGRPGHGRGAGDGEEIRAPVVVTSLHPRTRVPRPRRRARAARRLRHRHRALEVAQRRREGQPCPRPAARLHGRPRNAVRPSTTPAPSRWRRPWSSSRGRSRTRARAGPRSRRSATASSRPRSTRRSTPRARTSSRCSRSGSRATGSEEPHHRGARGVRRPAGRPVRRGGTRLQGLGHRTATSSARTRWSRSTAWSAATSSTASCRVEQLFHMRPAPGYADYRTPDRRALQRELRDPRRRRGLRHPRPAGGAGRDPGHRSRRAVSPLARLRSRVGRPARPRMLEPRSVAVVGASARPGSFGSGWSPRRCAARRVSRVHLVNPRLRHGPGPPLRAVARRPRRARRPGRCSASRDAQLADQLARRAGRTARGGAVDLRERGRPGSTRSRGRCRRAGRCVGGGCMGFVNVAGGVRALGYLERAALPPGGIALVTHSGSMFSALLRTHRRLEYTLAVSSGQELVTTTARLPPVGARPGEHPRDRPVPGDDPRRRRAAGRARPRGRARRAGRRPDRGRVPHRPHPGHGPLRRDRR